MKMHDLAVCAILGLSIAQCSGSPGASSADAGGPPAAGGGGEAAPGETAPDASDDGKAAPAPGNDSAAPALQVTTRCATAMVVGLAWNAIPGTALYAVSRDGSSLGTSATTGYSDTTVAAKGAYSYAVEARAANGSSLGSASLAVTTAAASPDGDAPYCPSDLVKSATWNWSTGFNQQNGSDLWPSTWGADGSTYLFFGDGGGFFGSNTAGRASFGIAALTGSGPQVDANDASNVYGGLDAAHASTINGKAGAILAVGNDFYALGGIYRSGDSGGPSGSPNHYEIISSVGNAYSWQDSAWSFCAADAEGNVTQGLFCATSFFHFGKGNAAAFDGYVYMTATPAAGWFSSTPTPGPASTYLMRVPNDAMTTQSAYTYFAGLDASGDPTWSADASDAQSIFVDRNTRPMGIGNVVYSPALKCLVGAAQGGTVAQVALYEAPMPWGPWSTISYTNTNPDGSGGFGDLGSSDYTPGHGDSLGINFIDAWTSADGLTMWAVFSSDGNAPSTALLPGLAGQDMDSFSLVSLTLGL
jgi:hypothetical protein